MICRLAASAWATCLLSTPTMRWPGPCAASAWSGSARSTISAGARLGSREGLPLGDLLAECLLVVLPLQREIDSRDLAGVVVAAIGRARMVVRHRLPIVADVIDLPAQDPGADVD